MIRNQISCLGSCSIQTGIFDQALIAGWTVYQDSGTSTRWGVVQGTAVEPVAPEVVQAAAADLLSELGQLFTIAWIRG
jgi:hypothetical protein